MKQAQVLKTWSLLLGSGALMVGAKVASAAFITYTLNCPFGGDPQGTACLTTSTSFGTVTISDATRKVGRNNDWYYGVDVRVDLNIGTKLVPLGLYLNFGEIANGDWGVVPGQPSFDLTVDFNNITAGGYSSGSFDLAISPAENGAAPYSFFLYNQGLRMDPGLDPAMFGYMDTGGRYYLAAHIGGCNGDCLPRLGENSDSIWVGATRLPTQNVPEPSSILLVGAALAGIVGLRRRRTMLLPQSHAVRLEKARYERAFPLYEPRRKRTCCRTAPGQCRVLAVQHGAPRFWEFALRFRNHRIER